MISVIIPVCNAEMWLKRCLDTIIQQTVFSELEIILIDDGSVDSSAQIIDDYVAEYSSFKGIHIQNQGVSNARNRGIDMASGDYIAFIDADDYIEPDYFEIMLKAAEDGADIVCSGFVAEYSSTSVCRCSNGKFILSHQKAIEEFLKGNIIDQNIWNKLFKTRVVHKIRFDERFRIAEDKYFLFQCIKRADCVQVLNIAKYHYVITEGSACRTSFSEKKFDSLIVAGLVTKEIKNIYPNESKLAESMEMDVKCRVYGEIYSYGVPFEYRQDFYKLKKEICSYSLVDKKRYSSTKHFLSFLAARIHPRLYNFLKNDMKLQYKN